MGNSRSKNKDPRAAELNNGFMNDFAQQQGIMAYPAVQPSMNNQLSNPPMCCPIHSPAMSQPSFNPNNQYPMCNGASVGTNYPNGSMQHPQQGLFTTPNNPMYYEMGNQIVPYGTMGVHGNAVMSNPGLPQMRQNLANFATPNDVYNRTPMNVRKYSGNGWNTYSTMPHGSAPVHGQGIYPQMQHAN